MSDTSCMTVNWNINNSMKNKNNLMASAFFFFFCKKYSFPFTFKLLFLCFLCNYEATSPFDHLFQIKADPKRKEKSLLKERYRQKGKEKSKSRGFHNFHFLFFFWILWSVCQSGKSFILFLSVPSMSFKLWHQSLAFLLCSASQVLLLSLNWS